MESLELNQSNRTLRAVRLAITVGPAMLFLAALLCGLREVTTAHADPGVRYVDGASGTDTTNCTSPTSPCATIGYALDQAEDFDTILVAQGTYTENLVITKTVTLEGGYEPGSWSRRLDRYTTIDGNQSGRVINVESSLSETTVIDGFTITNGDGGIRILLSSVAIQNSKIVDNDRTGWGSGGITIDRSYVTITNTLIADNHDGAMLIISTPVDPWVESVVHINNSTIANNGGHGIFCSLSWCIVVNSIVWGHEGQDFAGELGRCLVTYSDIEMMEWPGEGNISEDPRFVDPDNGDYRLRPDSPCIDAGNNEYAPETDFEGDPRPLDGDLDGTTVTDMGADEFHPNPGLAVTKQADPDPVQAGGLLTYTLRVTNTGDTRLHATITDVLPAHITPGTAHSGTLILPGGTLTWTPVVVAPGGVWTQQVVVTVAMGYSGTLTNVVRVTTEEGATGAYTETSRALVTPMLEVSKQADPSPVLSGALLTYTLLVTNTGNVTLTAIITDILPGHVSPTGVLTWMTVITAPGGVWTEAVVVTVETDYEGPLTNVVLVATDEGATGTASVTVCVNACKIYLPIVLKNYPSVDLSLGKTDNPDPVVAGNSLTYILTVDNAGPSDATGVQLTDNLPSGVAFVSATPSQGSCNHVGGTVTCNLGDIAIGSGATVTIQVAVAPSTIGMLNNSANVTGNETDLAPGSNAVSVTTMVNAEVDVTGIMCRVAVEDVEPQKIWLHQRHFDAYFTPLGLTPPFDVQVQPIHLETGNPWGRRISLSVDSFANSNGMRDWKICDAAMKMSIRLALCPGNPEPECDLEEIVRIEPPEARPPRTLRFAIEGG